MWKVIIFTHLVHDLFLPAFNKLLKKNTKKCYSLCYQLMKRKPIMWVIPVLRCVTAKIIRKTISRVEEFCFCSETACLVPHKRPDNILWMHTVLIHSLKTSHQSPHIWNRNTILFAKHCLRHFLSESASLMSVYITTLVFLVSRAMTPYFLSIIACASTCSRS